MASRRVYQKKEIRLDRLNFHQTQMFKIGTVGVAAVKNRAGGRAGADRLAGEAAHASYYAIRKTKLGKGNRRNLMLTGDMLRNFQVRTVSEHKAKAVEHHPQGPHQGVASPDQIEPWIVFSPKNKQVVRQTGAARSPGDRSRGSCSSAPSAVNSDDRPFCTGRQPGRDAARHSGPRRGDGRRAGADLRLPRPVSRKRSSLAHAIHQMPAPSIMVAWQGTAPGTFGGVDVWKHQVTLYPARAGDVRRRPADGVLPAVPADHQGRADRDRRSRCSTPRSTRPAIRWTCRRSSGRRTRRGWITFEVPITFTEIGDDD